ncbi:MAG: peptidoglycan-binding protein [Myxococcota bacterium]|nr:peptidoglycan-binding protein [Myxococcota bacterium]
MNPYVVRQGDFLTKLAIQHGFDAEEVWNHPKNESLRSVRASPDVLCPGDVLYLPPPRPKTWHPLTVGGDNRFVATVPVIKVSLKLTAEGAPLANKACRVEGAGPVLQLTTGGDGSLAFSVPMSATILALVFDDPPLRYSLCPGWMDPDTTASGVGARLANLGYVDQTAVHPDVIADALRAFQADNGIEPTGIMAEATRKALVGAHGH